MNTATYATIKKMSPQLLVTDIDVSMEFYTKKLGFEVDFRYEGFYAGLIKEGHSIHLKLKNNRSTKVRGRRRNNEDVDIIFSIGDIEIVYKELSNGSVKITQSLRAMPYGKEFYIADPDGYIIALLEEA